MQLFFFMVIIIFKYCWYGCSEKTNKQTAFDVHVSQKINDFNPTGIALVLLLIIFYWLQGKGLLLEQSIGHVNKLKLELSLPLICYKDAFSLAYIFPSYICISIINYKYSVLYCCFVFDVDFAFFQGLIISIKI